MPQIEDQGPVVDFVGVVVVVVAVDITEDATAHLADHLKGLVRRRVIRKTTIKTDLRLTKSQDDLITDEEGDAGEEDIVVGAVIVEDLAVRDPETNTLLRTRDVKERKVIQKAKMSAAEMVRVEGVHVDSEDDREDHRKARATKVNVKIEEKEKNAQVKVVMKGGVDAEDGLEEITALASQEMTVKVTVTQKEHP